MARRAQIVIDAKDLDVYDQLINEIKAKGYDVDENTATIEIHALAGYEPTVCKDLYILEDRLNNYIAVNGNKRVTKTELCKIARISRPTLNRWIEMGVISWNYFGSSFDLLGQWLLIFQGERPDDNNKLIECEFWGDSITEVFDTRKKGYNFASEIFSPCLDISCACCRLYQEGPYLLPSKIISIEQIKECEKRYEQRGKFRWGFWDYCRVILDTERKIRQVRKRYYERKYHSYSVLTLPAKMNLIAFSQQIRRIIDDFIL